MQVKDNSRNFRADWFLSQFESGREGPNLDFKRRPYELVEPGEQFEFAKDIVAFANVARRTNRKCRILFGVGENAPKVEGHKPGRIPFDVRNLYPCKKPQNWDDPNVSIHDKQINVVSDFYKIAEKWIDPDPVELFEYEYGEIDGTFYSYLEIKPTLTSRPYCLKRGSDKRDSPYRVGAVLVRKGASNARLEPSEVPYLFQWSQAAYLEQGEWQQIIRTHLAKDFETMQNISPPFQPRTNAADVNAFDAVMRFLSAGKRMVIVKGDAGSGKTVLLHRIAYALANQHNLDAIVRREQFGQADETGLETETVASITDELEVVPSFPVPIFMTLREAFGTIEHFEQQLLVQIREWTGQNALENLSQVFGIPGAKWVILLDGIDEIRDRQSFAPYLRTWIRGLPPNVQVVVSSRPAYAEFSSSGVAEVAIEPLTQEESLYLLMGNLPEDKADEDKKHQIENWILQQPDLLTMLACPRALFGLAQFLNPAKPSDQIQIDQDRIEVMETQKLSPESSGRGAIPSLDVNPNEESDLSMIGQVAEKDDGGHDDAGDKWIPPQPALALQAITTYMREQEIKRRGDWGLDIRRKAEQAQVEIDETAWRTDWEANGFDSLECERQGWITKDSCVWNEDLGFIRYVYPRRYRFLCDLVHHYFCAEHAFFASGEEEIKTELVRREVVRPATKSILGLLNQIRIENGRKELNLP